MNKNPNVHRRRHAKPRFQRQTRPGTMPGTLKANPNAQSPTLKLIAYCQEEFVEEEVESLDRLVTRLDGLDTAKVKWVNVDGLGDVDTIRQLGEYFDLHILALEDVLNVHQRAKVDAYDDHLFIVARRVELTDGHVESEQISIFIGKGFVLTLQERPGDCFDPIRQRLREKVGRIRSSPADYLAYALVDSIVDGYFPVVDAFADRLDSLEDAVIHSQDASVLERIHAVRNELLTLRRSIRPHRDALNSLARDEHPLVSAETTVFARDCYDHTTQLIELIEMYREMCTGLREHQLSLMSTRMNEIMKVLTIISTIFIPLSFVAGLYGMNFNTELPGNMPELNKPYAYVTALGAMSTMVVGMLAYFYRKGWLGGK